MFLVARGCSLPVAMVTYIQQLVAIGSCLMRHFAVVIVVVLVNDREGEDITKTIAYRRYL
jgi:hypothetical protein